MARRGTRKQRKATRRGRRAARRCWTARGGSAPVGDRSMNSSSALSHAQGKEYASIHANQHGGAAVSLVSSAPVGYTGVLDDSLRATARIGPLDQALNQIQGMSDQSGGGRRRRGKKRMSLKKLMSSVRSKVRKSLRKLRARKMRGGAGAQVGPVADYGSPGMLLSPAQEARALMGMNPEWRLAANPAAFAPRS
jgi:hypothetical protein